MATVDDRTTLNDMDVQADIDQWTATNFDAITLNDTNSPTRIFREGAGAGQIVMKANTDGFWVDDVAYSIDGGILNDKLLVMWLWFSGPESTSFLVDILVGMYDGTGGQGGAGIGGRWNYKTIIDNADAYGWTSCVVFPSQPDESQGVFANMVKSSMDSIELDTNNNTANDVKLTGIESVFTISYIGGHSQTVTLTNLVDHSKDKTNDRDFGVGFQSGDAYRFRVALRLGDASATANTTVNETAKVVHFDNFNSDHEIGFHFINDSSGDLNAFTLSGCFLFWNNGASAVFTGINNVDTWSVTGTTFLRAGPIELPTHVGGYVTNTNVFDSCGEIDIGDVTFEDNTISNATSGVKYVGTGTRRAKNNTYKDCTDGIHFDTAQTISMDGDKFSGNTDDIHFSGSGTLTINAINGANPVSSRVSGGGTVIINNAVTTLINVKDNDGANLQNARVFFEASDGTGDFPFEESVTITRTGGTATVSHTAHGMSNNDHCVIRGADQPEYNTAHVISNVSTNAYDYTVSGSPTTPATGTIICTGGILDGLTDVSGNISISRTFTLDTPMIGFVRKSTSVPRFKSRLIVGTVDNANGLTINVRMILDE